jgi:uncharacterized protein (TIGR03437 family)
MTQSITICLIASALIVQAQTPTTLTEFTAAAAGPTFLMQASNGNFYGITGLETQNSAYTIYTMTPSGATTALVGATGWNPVSLLQTSDGNFYGSSPYTNDGGIVFKMTPAGAVSTVHQFNGPVDGANPTAGLIQATDGNFYGVANQGGVTETSMHSGGGTVFKLTPSGTFTKLHDFSGPDGYNPVNGLVQGTDGNFYGVTEYGGSANCATGDAFVAGCGTVFKITPQGALTTLVSFTGPNGSLPSVMILGTDGNFYGVTETGGTGSCSGAYHGCGTFFKITPSGMLTTLHSFQSADGTEPISLIQASDGNFYGTTYWGGGGCIEPPAPAGCGAIFKATPQGAITLLYTFPPQVGSTTSGPAPGPIIQAANGNLYGVTALGGSSDNGDVYELSLGLPPLILPPAISAEGVVNGASFQSGIAPGAWFTIKGTNLASTTDSWNNAIVNGALPTTLDGVSVMVGNQAAYIAYVSATQINALVPSVPAGPAPVTVTAAGGTSQAVMAQIQAEEPAFFQWGNYAVATRQDFSLAVKNGTFPGTTTVPAKPGDVIILWGTGFGPTSPAAPAGVETPATTTYNTATAVSVTVGTATATVYGAALAPGYAGLYQVAIQIPAGLADGDYPVVAAINSVPSPSTTMITVQQ